jgi:predicted MFS family arabinose efflux permease
MLNDDRGEESRAISGARLVLIVCIAQIAVQIGAYVWVTLLPRLRLEWEIGPAEAGGITGAFYLAYMCAAPVLVSLTDRVDAKRVYLVGAALVAAGHLGFAFVVDGFWEAVIARAITGVGWAGVYMTGLKLLADRVDARLMRRAVAWHAAGIGASGAMSFLFGDIVANAFGWRAAFEISGWIAIAASGLVLLVAPSAAPPQHTGTRPGLLDFRPVLQNRQAMAYAVAYCVHTWEMSVLRGWIVAFLGYVALRAPDAAVGWVGPAMVATGLALLGTGVSVYGNELSIRIGRPRIVLLATLLSAMAAVLLGVAGPLSYWLAVVLSLLAGATIWLDSSTLTGGASEAAAPGRRGQTLALHTTLGYGGGAAGPVVMGLILAALSNSDGYTDIAWAVGFLHVAVLGLFTRIWFKRLVAEPAPAPHYP